MTILRLVVSNSSIQEKELTSFPPVPSAKEFTVDIKDPGPCLYEMTARDPLHGLTCILSLEIEECLEDPKSDIVICHLSNVYDQEMMEWVEKANPLYGIVVTQFQMKLAEQLLLFCATHHASQLIIYRDSLQTHSHSNEVRQDFWDQLDQILTKKKQQSKLVISFQPETLDTLINFMDQTNLRLKQDLWNEQRSNLAIRQYLTAHPFG